MNFTDFPSLMNKEVSFYSCGDDSLCFATIKLNTWQVIRSDFLLLHLQLFDDVATSHPRHTTVFILLSRCSCFQTPTSLPWYLPPTSLGRTLPPGPMNLSKGRAMKILTGICPRREGSIIPKMRDTSYYLLSELGCVLQR